MGLQWIEFSCWCVVIWNLTLRAGHLKSRCATIHISTSLELQHAQWVPTWGCHFSLYCPTQTLITNQNTLLLCPDTGESESFGHWMLDQIHLQSSICILQGGTFYVSYALKGSTVIQLESRQRNGWWNAYSRSMLWACPKQKWKGT